MALSRGDRLGPYEILAPLGAGGMGEVWKARDTRLDRSVAIKVLPEHIAQREDLRARFEREARSVASLSHPHICTLHDIGEDSGTSYMVMELLEGQTLAERITKGPIPIDQAVPLAIQIADALDRAHRAGVTHRDVKPGNIMLTRDGVKVLDFGLAKSTAKPGPSEATLTNAISTEGSVFGTPLYMAPEQLEGREADARSDIWAFGAVLYEMLTSRKAFGGKNYALIVGAILTVEPPPMTVKPFTPAWLERIVRRCLEKDPEDRWQAMRDVVIELNSPTPEVVPTPAKPSRSWQAITAVSALAAVFFAGLSLWMREPAESVAPVRLELNAPNGERLTMVDNFDGAGGTAISPDGRTLAFILGRQGDNAIHVRPMDSPNARELPGTGGAGRPFWSPDSKSIAFVAHGKLKKVDLAGGTPVALCDAGNARGGAWSEEGVILLAGDYTELRWIPASGGTLTAAPRLNEAEGEQHHFYPQFLPGGKKFIYLVVNEDAKKTGIAVASLDGGSPAFLVPSPSRAIYDSGSGRLLYLNEAGTLMARRLELDPPRLSGDAATVADSVRAILGFSRYADVSVSANGTLFFSQGNQLPPSRFVWRDRTGKLLEKVGDPVSGDRLSLSPDGLHVAFSETNGTATPDVWVRNLQSGASTRITFQGGWGPRWSADGKHLYYLRGRTSVYVYRRADDGSGEEEVICDTCLDTVSSLSADGKFLLSGAVRIIAVPLEGERKPWEWLRTDAAAGYGAFSPDSRWVAYRSEETGRPEIYVQGFPEKRGKWSVSQGSGRGPKWRADGKELYWIAPSGELMAAPIDSLPAVVRVGKPEALFRLPSGYSGEFEPARDGRRFLSLEPEGPPREPPMVVILNWAAGLER